MEAPRSLAQINSYEQNTIRILRERGWKGKKEEFIKMGDSFLGFNMTIRGLDLKKILKVVKEQDQQSKKVEAVASSLSSPFPKLIPVSYDDKDSKPLKEVEEKSKRKKDLAKLDKPTSSKPSLRPEDKTKKSNPPVSLKINDIEVALFLEVLKKVLISIEQGKPNISSLLLGDTGAGKSTIVNYLSGINYIQREDETGKIVLEPEKEELTKTSEGLESFTTEFHSYEKKGDSKNIFLIDSPGFLDTRSNEYLLAIEVGFTELFKTYRPKSLIITMDISDLVAARMPKFQELCKKLCPILFTHEELSLLVQKLGKPWSKLRAINEEYDNFEKSPEYSSLSNEIKNSKKNEKNIAVFRAFQEKIHKTLPEKINRLKESVFFVLTKKDSAPRNVTMFEKVQKFLNLFPQSIARQSNGKPPFNLSLIMSLFHESNIFLPDFTVAEVRENLIKKLGNLNINNEKIFQYILEGNTSETLLKFADKCLMQNLELRRKERHYRETIKTLKDHLQELVEIKLKSTIELANVYQERFEEIKFSERKTFLSSVQSELENLNATLEAENLKKDQLEIKSEKLKSKITQLEEEINVKKEEKKLLDTNEPCQFYKYDSRDRMIWSIINSICTHTGLDTSFTTFFYYNDKPYNEVEENYIKNDPNHTLNVICKQPGIYEAAYRAKSILDNNCTVTLMGSKKVWHRDKILDLEREIEGMNNFLNIHKGMQDIQNSELVSCKSRIECLGKEIENCEKRKSNLDINNENLFLQNQNRLKQEFEDNKKSKENNCTSRIENALVGISENERMIKANTKLLVKLKKMEEKVIHDKNNLELLKKIYEILDASSKTLEEFLAFSKQNPSI